MTRRYDNLIGIPWYHPERYDDARARMADAKRLPPTYDLWRERAEQREHQVRCEGHTPSRVYVDDDQFVAFCAERGQILDSKARSQFALSKAVGHWKANVTNYDDPVSMRWK